MIHTLLKTWFKFILTILTKVTFNNKGQRNQNMLVEAWKGREREMLETLGLGFGLNNSFTKWLLPPATPQPLKHVYFKYRQCFASCARSNFWPAWVLGKESVLSLNIQMTALKPPCSPADGGLWGSLPTLYTLAITVFLFPCGQIFHPCLGGTLIDRWVTESARCFLRLDVAWHRLALIRTELAVVSFVKIGCWQKN